MNPSTDPIYTIAEAARYLQLPSTTLSSWVFGRTYDRHNGTAYFEPIIQPPAGSRLLSFFNLVEAHVLRALRQKHGVSLKAVRKALQYAQDELRIERLLLHESLRTEGGQLFLDMYGQLINLSQSGQLALRIALRDHLERVEWEKASSPAKLYPFIPDAGIDKVIVIDPRVAFGRPITTRNSISTAIIADRIDAGETLEELSEDYELEAKDIESAVLYERYAA